MYEAVRDKVTAESKPKYKLYDPDLPQGIEEKEQIEMRRVEELARELVEKYLGKQQPQVPVPGNVQNDASKNPMPIQKDASKNENKQKETNPNLNPVGAGASTPGSKQASGPQNFQQEQKPPEGFVPPPIITNPPISRNLPDTPQAGGSGLPQQSTPTNQTRLPAKAETPESQRAKQQQQPLAPADSNYNSLNWGSLQNQPSGINSSFNNPPGGPAVVMSTIPTGPASSVIPRQNTPKNSQNQPSPQPPTSMSKGQSTPKGPPVQPATFQPPQKESSSNFSQPRKESDPKPPPPQPEPASKFSNNNSSLTPPPVIFAQQSEIEDVLGADFEADFGDHFDEDLDDLKISSSYNPSSTNFRKPNPPPPASSASNNQQSSKPAPPPPSNANSKKLQGSLDDYDDFDF